MKINALTGYPGKAMKINIHTVALTPVDPDEIYRAKIKVVQNEAKIIDLLKKLDPISAQRLQAENRSIKRDIRNRYNIILE